MANTNNYNIWALNVLPIVFDDYVSQKDLFVKMVRYINGLIGDTVTLYNDFTSLDTGTIGDLDDLHTTEKASIVGAINEVEDDVEALKTDKLDSPALAGTAGQVLTSDGEGGQVWAAVGSGEIVVDNTLTVSGAAADAKVTGDEITSLKTDNNELKSAISEDRSLLGFAPVVGPNKWNPDEVQENKNISNNINVNYGELVNDTGYYTSDYIEIESGDTVSWYYNSNAGATSAVKNTMFRVAEYDEDKVVVKVSSNWAASPYQTQPTTKYVRVVLNTLAAINMVCLNYSENSLTYIPYESTDEILRVSEIEGKADDSVIQSSINKWNPAETVADKDISTGAIDLGSLVDKTGYTTSGFIPILKGQNIIHYVGNNASLLAVADSAFRIGEYDKNKKCLQVTGNWPSVPYTVQNTNTRYVRIVIYGAPAYVLAIVDDESIVQKPYVPFVPDYNLLSKLSRIANPADVILPSAIYGVTGQQINIYKENLVAGNRLKSLAYLHTCMPDNATQDDQRTIWNPSASALTEADQNWEIFKYGFEDTPQTKTIKVCKVPKDTGSSSIKVLIIGDSKVANGWVTYHFLHNFDDDNMTCTLLGTQYKWTTDNRGEGYGSRTAKWFCTNASSPLSNNGACDFANYLSANSIATPDFVFINLGTNDVGADTTGYAEEYVTYITQMITSIHAVSSSINVIVGLCEGVCTVDDTNNAKFLNWDLNHKISHLHEAAITVFDNQSANHIYVCPMYMGMDLTQDYNMTEVPLSARDGDVNNGSGNGKTRMQVSDPVHQSEVGYWKNADYMYALVKYIVAKAQS